MQAVAADLIILCPNSQLSIFLALASQLFLVSLLSLVIIYLLLYGLKDEDPVLSNRHFHLIFQFFLIGIMIAAAFIFLGAALLTATVGKHDIGIIGLVLLSTLEARAIVIGFTIAIRSKGLSPTAATALTPEAVAGLSSAAVAALSP